MSEQTAESDQPTEVKFGSAARSIESQQRRAAA